ncbi:MAG: DUF992 domain-containing protein [Alphaproteobacteria bacterium]|jgi:hypothetical protein|nr:DUF992 domain-containing protein [Alphaproteobacteria bacterium]
MQKHIVAVLAGLLLAGTAAGGSAWAQEGVNVGMLKCKTIPGTATTMIIHSSVGLDCVFETPNGKESYKGESGIGLGLDLSWDRTEYIAYTVLSVSKDYKMGSHSLAGKFVGAKASATVGVGAGAAALIGGGDKNISLQPLALEGSTGWGVSGGASYLFLEPDPTKDK